MVSASALSVRFRGVPVGRFSVMVRTLGKNGAMSRGALATISLPGVSGGSTSSMPPMTNGSDLPESGPLTVLIMLLAGAATGAMEVWRRQKKLGVL